MNVRLAVLLLLAVSCPGVARADSVNTKDRTVTQVADGVYVIRHPDAPDGFPQGNTTVVIGEREVLVVDSCYLPSSAREDIAQIRTWTNRPVRYLVNTHWHYDHVLGNGAYAQAFPGLSIVAHAETRDQLAGYTPGYMERYPARASVFKKMLETGKDQDGKPLSEVEKRDYERVLPGFASVGAEFKDLAATPPDLLIEGELVVDLGNRLVRIAHLGRGNTAGDVVVYLPKERILATGDLLDHPVPYLGGGFPSEEVVTLERMAELDAETIVPGHGEVLRGATGRAYLAQVIEFIRAVVAEVGRETYRVGSGPRNLEAVREGVLKKIDVAAWRKRFAGDDPDNADFFDGFALSGLITAAYAETWRR